VKNSGSVIELEQRFPTLRTSTPTGTFAYLLGYTYG